MKLENFNIFNGSISGKGSDEIGKFLVVGQMLPDCTVNFTKQYVEKNQFVNYTGLYDKESSITGTWSVPNSQINGDFQLFKSYWDI